MRILCIMACEKLSLTNLFERICSILCATFAQLFNWLPLVAMFIMHPFYLTSFHICCKVDAKQSDPRQCHVRPWRTAHKYLHVLFPCILVVQICVHEAPFVYLYRYVYTSHLSHTMQAAASESLHSNAATVHALYTGFKPVAYNGSYLNMLSPHKMFCLVQLS